MVDFHAISHIPYTTPAILKFVCYEAYFVASLNETLAKLVAMGLDSTKLGKGEVSAN
jgi:hypothetical protein